MLKSAYLIVICNQETNAIEESAIWSSPEWEQSLCLPNKNVFVAYHAEGETFASAKKVMLQLLEIPNFRYSYLKKYFPIEPK